MEPEQWLQRHPEAGLSWPSWPKASQLQIPMGTVYLNSRDANSVNGFDSYPNSRDTNSVDWSDSYLNSCDTNSVDLFDSTRLRIDSFDGSN